MSRAPYILAALALGIVSIVVAFVVFTVLAGSSAAACIQGGSAAQSSSACAVPAGIAGIILLGGLYLAGRVWTRR